MIDLIVGAIMCGGPWDKRHESIRRVYMADGLAPTVTAGGGGGVEPKVILFEDDFVPGDIVTVKGYEELGPAEVQYIDSTERDYPYYIAWFGGDSEYEGYFEFNQLVKCDSNSKGSDKLTKPNEIKYEGKPFKYASLFSGIGGFEQALNKLGGECVFASEIDKFAAQAYEVLYGDKPHGDITQIDTKDIPDHDLLVGGFPCQAFSVAGQRKGFEDTRGTLFFEVARIAAEKQPKALLLENVKGLVGHDKGRTLDTIVQTLNDIGYTVDFEVLNSKYFGVPQNRERIFIIAIRDDLVTKESWIIEGNTVVPKGKRRISAYEGIKTFNFDWPEQGEVTTRLRDILKKEVDEKYYLDEEKTAKLVAQLEEKDDEPRLVGGIGEINFGKQYRQGNRIYDADAVAMCLHAQPVGNAGGNSYLYKVNEEPQMLGHIDIKGHDAVKRVYSAESVGPTLTTMGGGHREPKTAVTEGTRYRIRKLSPLECFRLQGFPDEAHQALVDAGISDSQRYKQAGNAVTVNVISAIGKRLLPYIDA